MLMVRKKSTSTVEVLEPRCLLSAVPAPARGGALFTQSYAVSHPSQPNYLAMFSGSDQGIADDNGPISFPGPDLASALAAKGRTFTGYSEDLPSVGSKVLQSGAYARKHNP